MIRIGVISYINSVPLRAGLEHYGELVFDTPRNLAEQFKEGTLDVAFIPSVDYILNKNDYCLVEDVSISSFGNTNSVFLIFKGDVHDLRSVHLSPDSLTANQVIQCILAESYGARPQCYDASQKGAFDARVLIGDGALHIEDVIGTDERFIDVGAAWYELTQLPMVYAVCASKEPQLAVSFAEPMRTVKQHNLSRVHELLARAKLEQYEPYINGLNYDLNNDHKQALSILEQLMQKEPAVSGK